MGIIAGYEHDVFVSYAHIDNTPIDSEKESVGWIENFVLNLECSLKQRLGGGDKLSVYFDERDLTSNTQVEELRAIAASSALLLVVGSRGYISRKYPLAELTSFASANPDASKIFVVECLPLDADETYPSPIDDHARLPFWHVDEPRSDTPIPLRPDTEKFRARMADLAEQIRRRLKQQQLQSLAGTPLDRRRATASSTGASTAQRKSTVVLAQVTDDLDDESDQVRRYLEQFDVNVLPKEPYPLGGEQFKTAFLADLKEADLFIQLLGPRPGKTPPDLPLGYPRHQWQEAVAATKPILQWRHPDLLPSSARDPHYAAMLSGPDVVATGLEAFKAHALSRLKRKPVESKPSLPNLVFVNADRSDLDVARAIREELRGRGYPVAMPLMGDNAEENRADLTGNLRDFETMVVIYGAATPGWVRTQLRFYSKLRNERDSEPRLIAICKGPPTPKPDIDFDLPHARELEPQEDWVAAIKSLIVEINP